MFDGVVSLDLINGFATNRTKLGASFHSCFSLQLDAALLQHPAVRCSFA